MIEMQWPWSGKVGCCPLLCQGIRICRIPVEWIVWPCRLAKVRLIPALGIASWCHIELVHLDKVSAVVCWLCGGIVLMLSSRSLALTNAPGVFCSPSPMLSQCILFLSNRMWVCNVPWVCFWDVGHVPRLCISPQSCQQPMWIVSAVCHVSKDRVPICFVGSRICSIVFWGIRLPIILIAVGHIVLAWLWCRRCCYLVTFFSELIFFNNFIRYVA